MLVIKVPNPPLFIAFTRTGVLDWLAIGGEPSRERGRRQWRRCLPPSLPFLPGRAAMMPVRKTEQASAAAAGRTAESGETPIDADCPGGCPAGEMPARDPNFLRNFSPKTWLTWPSLGPLGMPGSQGHPANPRRPPPCCTFPQWVPNSIPSSAWLPDAAHPQTAQARQPASMTPVSTV